MERAHGITGFHNGARIRASKQLCFSLFVGSVVGSVVGSMVALCASIQGLSQGPEPSQLPNIFSILNTSFPFMWNKRFVWLVFVHFVQCEGVNTWANKTHGNLSAGHNRGGLDATPPALLLRLRNTGHSFWTFESSGLILRLNGRLLKSNNSLLRLCSTVCKHTNGGSVGDRGKGKRIQHATTRIVGLPLLAAPATGSWQSAKDRTRVNGAKPTMR
jgi:hypothetical protein